MQTIGTSILFIRFKSERPTTLAAFPPVSMPLLLPQKLQTILSYKKRFFPFLYTTKIAYQPLHSIDYCQGRNIFLLINLIIRQTIDL